MKPRAYRIELALMEAEYLLDSTTAHCRMAKCTECLGFYSRKRMERALNKVRAARDLIRNEQGIKQWTLFASSGGKTNRGKGKSWSHHTPHKWMKDCSREAALRHLEREEE